MVKLRNERFHKTVGELEVGETAWIIPQALAFDKDKNVYLPKDLDTREEMFGTARLQIFREEVGFTIDLRRVDRKFSKGDTPIEANDTNYIPVVRVIDSYFFDMRVVKNFFGR